jgi:hypothetical protein
VKKKKNNQIFETAIPPSLGNEMIVLFLFVGAALCDIVKVRCAAGVKCTVLTHSDEFVPQAFEQSVITAREAGSGLATGRRQYQ